MEPNPALKKWLWMIVASVVVVYLTINLALRMGGS
jgi:hypothetical protein